MLIALTLIVSIYTGFRIICLAYQHRDQEALVFLAVVALIGVSYFTYEAVEAAQSMSASLGSVRGMMEGY